MFINIISYYFTILLYNWFNDIWRFQTGKGPFAPIANGLVKIGETMTLVVTVDGDPGFNILVRECVARDSNPESGNLLQLTDAQGCVAKPKLFGSFQTTTNPATGSLIAYANFQVCIVHIYNANKIIQIL